MPSTTPVAATVVICKTLQRYKKSVQTQQELAFDDEPATR
ncbi:hypothetical protein AA0119_g8933 [Alternaria tenuissima]|uniref:Uncharacterized protein n=1 Tax=Alternaria tenuissima TaxID=119927 RepID=A0ABY0G3Q3_9PLEO|nr:hypothetical protein AA0119_g8933 [Alternaria tenuissima]RYO10812.1 hypothetical protein AA0121_g10482 [Alternaria tenuissima]